MTRQELADKAFDMVRENTLSLLDLFAPGVQNRIMKKRLKNAELAIEGIKEKLSEYGLEVDYERYFEEKLHVPLKAMRALSEVETVDQREMLQTLFARHIAGEYEDDGNYASFIGIIEELDSEDIRYLQRLKACEDSNEEQPPAEDASGQAREDKLFRYGLIDKYHEIEVLKTEREVPTGIDAGGTEPVVEALTWGMMLGEQKALQVGSPYFTEYGREFMKACTEPLK